MGIAIKIILITLMVITSLSACRQQKNTEYFLLHPKELQSTYDQCVYFNDKIADRQAQECIAVLRAIPIFRSYLAELINTPHQFANNLMQAEIKLVQLKKAYAVAKQNAGDQKLIQNLEADIFVQELEIQIRFALIRVTTK